ncbi:MAG: hypothetical protein AAGI38_14635 [Bacteroidota bacterium]
MRSLIILILAVLVSGCFSEGTGEKDSQLQQPDMELYPQFGYKPSGKIVYQLYHEYGFTDVVCHLITILVPDSVEQLAHDLPIDSGVMAQVPEIYTEKFVEGYPIQFFNEFSMNADISNKVKRFHDTTFNINISHVNGTYTIRRIGKTHMLKLIDEDSGLAYVELKYSSGK